MKSPTVIFLACLLSWPALHGQPQDWRLVANPPTLRESHTANLLADGRVLIAGGLTVEGDHTDRTECYLPDSGQWVEAGRMQQGRSYHTATLLNDGRVLAVGGEDGSVQLASAEIFDSQSDEWTAAAPMSLPRSRHSATLLANGLVLVAGGEDAQSAGQPAEMYDPATDSWAPAATPATARREHTASLLPDGRVLLAGGIDPATAFVLDHSEIFDPQGSDWETASPMAFPRAAHIAQPLPDGRILAAGGSDGRLFAIASCEIFDPQSQQWSTTDRLPRPLRGHSAARLADGRVLIAGSLALIGSRDAAIFDPSSETWSEARDLQQGHSRHSLTTLPDGRVLLVGGFAYSQSLGSEIFGPTDVVLYPGLALGGGFEVFLSLTNQSSQIWQGRLVLDGGFWPPLQPWTLDGADRSGTSEADLVLQPDETRKIVLGSPRGPFSGWLELQANFDSRVEDLATSFFYSFAPEGELIASTGVAPALPVQAMRFPVEQTEQVKTGLALRLAESPIEFTLYDQQGTIIESFSEEFSQSRFIDEIFSAVPADFLGSVKVQSASPFFLSVLRQEIIPAAELRFQLTSIPGASVPEVP